MPLFRKKFGTDFTVEQIYGDDIIFCVTNESLCKDFSKLVHNEFEMRMMGKLKFFLGLQIKQIDKDIYIHQHKYIKELLSKFKMNECNAYTYAFICGLSKDKLGKPIDQTIYKGTVGSLLYLTTSRPNIMFSVCLCTKFQSNPIESHLKVVKHIFRYLAGSINLSLFYEKNNNFRLVRFCDVDYARDRICGPT
uniref:Reverse transcriptase Ty1/copia-type domain-containing protein n=1 Tax=Cajanus cajan TaxID=3821 RepID=A0A151SG44_CAJCA|nr:hypothetical protein KK1_024350 [Cajanus cajan]